MVEMKSSILDSYSSSLSSSHRGQIQPLLVRADPLAAQPPTARMVPLPPPTAPAAYPVHDTYMEVHGGVIEAVASAEDPVATTPAAATHDDDDVHIVTAAGVGSGIVGLLVGGPILGLVLGFGAAYAATEHPQGHLVGDTARAVGAVALSAQARARVINDQHHVVERTQQAAQQAWNHAQQLDREHGILDKAQEMVVFSWKATVSFVREHNLVERGVRGIGKGVCWLLEKVMPGCTTTRTTDAPNGQRTAEQRTAATGVQPIKR